LESFEIDFKKSLKMSVSNKVFFHLSKVISRNGKEIFRCKTNPANCTNILIVEVNIPNDSAPAKEFLKRMQEVTIQKPYLKLDAIC